MFVFYNFIFHTTFEIYRVWHFCSISNFLLISVKNYINKNVCSPVHQLSRTLQCTSISEGGGFDYDQNWICAMWVFCHFSVDIISTRFYYNFLDAIAKRNKRCHNREWPIVSKFIKPIFGSFSYFSECLETSVSFRLEMTSYLQTCPSPQVLSSILDLTACVYCPTVASCQLRSDLPRGPLHYCDPGAYQGGKSGQNEWAKWTTWFFSSE